jgi:hypothetical protein
MTTLSWIRKKWFVSDMTYLHQLKKGQCGRLVAFDHEADVKRQSESKGIFEGGIISVISHHFVMVFRIDSRCFALSKKLVENLRVIPLNTMEG